MPLDLAASQGGNKYTRDDLVRLTETMITAMQDAIANSTDADVIFVPVDAEANDTYASESGDVSIAWTLGHVVVHATASAEEAAFIAAELARGIEREGRSRYEVPWETVTTIEQCRQRLVESRRIRLATLDTWPDEPHLETAFRFSGRRQPYDAYGRFVTGLQHDNSHIDQIIEIVRQAAEARATVAS